MGKFIIILIIVLLLIGIISTGDVVVFFVAILNAFVSVVRALLNLIT